jgi:hypothetical protein
MEKIAKLNMSSLQKRFEQDSIEKDYFYFEGFRFSLLPKEPYRTETYGIGLYESGNIRLKMGLINNTVQGPVMISMGPSVIRYWQQIEDTKNCKLLFFTESFYLNWFGFREEMSNHEPYRLYIVGNSGCGSISKISMGGVIRRRLPEWELRVERIEVDFFSWMISFHSQY